ncbi:hypothetical protein KKI23_03310, partial [Patescibacteria group bacterium]|nr:hypothetical protein [Patescibacteria group bacterium]
NAEIAGGLTVGGSLTAASATIEGSLTVNSALTADSGIIGDDLTVGGDLTVDGDLTASGSPMLKKTVYTGSFDLTDGQGDIQTTSGGNTYYWETVDVPEISISNMPIVQVFTGRASVGSEMYPDLDDSFVNVSFLLATFMVEDGRVHILFRYDDGVDNMPIYDDEDYKIVIIY